MMKRFFFSVLSLFVCSFVLAENASPIQTVLLPFKEAVIASRVDSVLICCKFRIGNKFKKNDVLLEMDSSKYAIVLTRTSAKRTFSAADYKDKKELRSQNVASDWELKKAEHDSILAQTDFDEAVLNVSFCTIRAPFSGKIAELLTREYETVRIGQPLCKIIADDRLLAVMNVPVREKELTRIGQIVTIRLNDGRKLQGKIYEVSPITDNRTGTVRIRVLIDNAEGKYSAGQTGVLDHAGK